MRSIKDFILLTLFGTFVSLGLGCNGNVHISGKVTYPDGTPLSTGQILFTDDFYMAKSDISKSGEYSLHSYRRNDGIRKGVYKVYITGAMRFEQDDDSKAVGLASFTPLGRAVDLIDRQHTNPDASGWEFDLKKSQKIDFIVYPPGEVPEEERTEAAKMLFDEEYRKKMLKESENLSKPEKKHSLVNPNLL